MRLELWLLDDADHPEYVANLLDLWIAPALEDLDDFGRLRPATWAAIFGARARTDRSLLASADWTRVLQMVPHPDDKPPHTREADAERLAESQLRELAWCKRELDEWIVRCAAGLLESPASEEDVDACVNLVTRVDAMSRAAIAIAWLVDAHGPVPAPAARRYLGELHRFMHGFSGSADRLLLAEELVWAIGHSFSPDVLSSGREAVAQMVATASLPQPAREARESAVWFSEVYGAFEGCAVELSQAEAASDSDVVDALHSLADMRASMGHLRLHDSSEPARRDCARWCIDRARSAGVERCERAAPLSLAILTRPPILAAAADGLTEELLVVLEWRDPMQPGRVAECELRLGCDTATVKFFLDGAFDKSINGQAVRLMGMSAVASGAEAHLALAPLRHEPPATIMDRLAQDLSVLEVGSRSMDLVRWEASGL